MGIAAVTALMSVAAITMGCCDRLLRPARLLLPARMPISMSSCGVCGLRNPWLTGERCGCTVRALLSITMHRTLLLIAIYRALLTVAMYRTLLLIAIYRALLTVAMYRTLLLIAIYWALLTVAMHRTLLLIAVYRALLTVAMYRTLLLIAVYRALLTVAMYRTLLLIAVYRALLSVAMHRTLLLIAVYRALLTVAMYRTLLLIAVYRALLTVAMHWTLLLAVTSSVLGLCLRRPSGSSAHPVLCGPCPLMAIRGRIALCSSRNRPRAVAAIAFVPVAMAAVPASVASRSRVYFRHFGKLIQR